ncbi:dihydrofolate reductase [Spongiibacter taiwanensis]|uniref:dihydrofolate reductase n=1 Tax=Spongiibacter taiwanensis TaxID=1748242 RepID=UPI002035ED17|nr:dihydrofolate reductase [Spongiibacter taiwanensis]USA42110.1 dihydrofolate reductase [Spongiibacter taiwanensis]
MSNAPTLEPRIAMIVAMNQDRVIGVNNTLPWHLPEDLKHFKQLTMGKPIVMGRNTWDSIGKPLPGRTNIVVTSQSSWHAEGALRAASPEQAMALAAAEAARAGIDEIFIIGGQKIYSALLNRAERVYLTEVEVDVEGDAWFPELESTSWQEVDKICYPKVEGQRPAFCFKVLQRV